MGNFKTAQCTKHLSVQTMINSNNERISICLIISPSQKKDFEKLRRWNYLSKLDKDMTFSLGFHSSSPDPEAHSEPCHTSKMELFAKIVNGSQTSSILAKNYILDVGQGSEYTC